MFEVIIDTEKSINRRLELGRAVREFLTKKSFS
jgi:hypothetical protein